MKTYQIKRNLKNVWVSSEQAAAIFATKAEYLDWLILHVGKTAVRTRLSSDRSRLEYCLFDICRKMGENGTRLEKQTLLLSIALCVLCATAVPLAAAFLTQ